MRITQIDIKNFRAFYGHYTIELEKTGKNLIIYGENGSGKSSLFSALQNFIDSYNKNLNFADYRNIFSNEEGYIKLYLRKDRNSKQTIFEWSETAKETDDILILELAKTRGFLDYKSLLEIHFLHPKNNEINLFNLLINSILANMRYDFDDNNQTFAENWSEIQQAIPTRKNATKKADSLDLMLEKFNDSLKVKLEQLETKITDILNIFGDTNVQLKLEFNGVYYQRDSKRLTGQEINLKIDFFNRPIAYPHQFLNEAKLSAIALSIYLSSLLIIPKSDLKLLVLDDVLIGLDMSNRLPIIDVLNTYFQEYQIILMTYDKEWYEVLKMRTKPQQWKYIELYTSQTDTSEIPIYAEDQKYLEKAQFHLDNNDYKASAIYLRTAFETAVQSFCSKKRLKIAYKNKFKELSIGEFWNAIKEQKPAKNNGELYVDDQFAFDVELYRGIILNPLSHHEIANIPKREIQKAIDLIKRLQQTFLEK